MRSDRNTPYTLSTRKISLIDWDMRSDRNYANSNYSDVLSLIDWDMRSTNLIGPHPARTVYWWLGTLSKPIQTVLLKRLVNFCAK